MVGEVKMAAQQPYFDKVFHKSCERMDELPDDTVALTVTSPPYWNAIDYDRHAQDPEQYYRTRNYAVGYADYEDYLQWYTRVSSEILRVTKPGGFYAVVIGTVLLNGTHFAVPFDVTSRFCRNGWTFHQDFIWHKVTGGVKRAGVFLQHPYPGYFYPNIMTEYILIFRKPGPPLFRDKSEEAKEGARVPTERLFTNDVANNVWHVAPVPPGHLDHPCPFPEEIPHRLVQLYSYPGDLVLDPFCGSGQTLKVARCMGRHYVGYEISAKYAALARQRVDEGSGLRAEQIVAAWEKIAVDAPRTGNSRGKTRYGKRRPAGAPGGSSLS